MPLYPMSLKANDSKPPVKRPRPNMAAIMLLAFSAFSSETILGPYVMQRDEQYPLDSEKSSMNKMYQESCAKTLGMLESGLLQNRNKGMKISRRNVMRYRILDPCRGHIIIPAP